MGQIEISDSVKKEIDAMDYVSMLRRWRFAPTGDPIFRGEVGKYYAKVMTEKDKALTHEERVAISKRVG